MMGYNNDSTLIQLDIRGGLAVEDNPTTDSSYLASGTGGLGQRPHNSFYTGDFSAKQNWAFAVNDSGTKHLSDPQAMVNFARLENNGDGNFHLEFVNASQNTAYYADYGVGFGFYDSGLQTSSPNPSPFIICAHTTQFSNTSSAPPAISIAMDGSQNVSIGNIYPYATLTVYGNVFMTSANAIIYQYPPVPLTSDSTDISGSSYGNGTYTVSGSIDTETSGDGWLLFDFDTTTPLVTARSQYDPGTGAYIGANSTTVGGNPVLGETIQINFTSLFQFSTYTLWEGNPGLDLPGKWVVAGSLDGGTTWTQVDSQEHSIGDWSSGNIVVSGIDGPAYSSYILIVTNTVTASSYSGNFQLAEWSIYMIFPPPATELTVIGNVLVSQTLTANYLSGDGSLLTNLTGGNVSGTVGYADYVVQAAQSAITSVGTLTGLTSSGTVTAAHFSGDGAGLSNINASNITQPFANLVVSNSVTTKNVVSSSLIVFGAITSNAANTTLFYDTLTIPYINTLYFTASNIAGNGAALNSLNASNLLGSANLLSLNVARLETVSNLIVTLANIGTLNVTSAVTFSNVSGNGAGLTALNALNITTGILSSSLIYGNTLSNINASNITTGILSSSLIYGNTLSNIQSSNITQPFANLVVSNSLTVTNVFANTETLTGTIPPIIATTVISLSYGNGIYVGVTPSTTGAYSTDGKIWSTTTLPNSSWSSTAYGLVGVTPYFVAVSSTTSDLPIYSTNGTVWNSGTISSSGGILYSVTYSASYFVAVGSFSGSAGFAYSTNGTSWTIANTGGPGTYSAVTYGGTYFVAVSQSNQVAWSTNATSWSYGANLPSTRYWSSVAYGGSYFVAISRQGGASAYTTNPTTAWTAVALPSTQYWISVTYGKGTFVAVSQSTSGVAGTAAAYTTNPSSGWTSSTLPSSQIWQTVIYNGSYFITTGGGAVALSYDGISWYLTGSIPTMLTFSAPPASVGKLIQYSNPLGGSFAVDTVGAVTASNVSANGLGLYSMSASNVTTGTLGNSLLPSIISVSNVSANGLGLYSMSASNVTTGTLDNSLLPSNIAVSNTLTSSNLYLSGGGLTGATGGNIVKGAVEFNTTDNVFYSTTVNLRGLSPSIFTYRLTAAVTLGSQGSSGTTACSWLSGTTGFGVTLPVGLYKVRGKLLFTVTQAATSGTMNTVWTGLAGYTIGITTQTVLTTSAFTTAIAATAPSSIDNVTKTTVAIHPATLTAATATNFYVMMDGFVNVTVAGTVIPQIANSAAGLFTVLQSRAGTYIEFTMVGRQGVNPNIAGWA